jgi:hypothetical protein
MRWQDFFIQPHHLAAYVHVASDPELGPSLAPIEAWLFEFGATGDSVHTAAAFAARTGVPLDHAERIAAELLSELAGDDGTFDWGVLIILHAKAQRAARSNQTPLRGNTWSLPEGPALSRARTFPAPPPMGKTG